MHFRATDVVYAKQKPRSSWRRGAENGLHLLQAGQHLGTENNLPNPQGYAY